MPRGRLPTGMVATTLSDEASMTVTLFERSFETYTSGSAPPGAGAPSTANESSAPATRPSVMARPPSRCEPASTVRHRGAEGVEVLAAHVREDRERPERSRDVLPLPRPDHVERLPELVIPPAKREGLTLVAVERRRRLHERDEGGPVARAGPDHRLADELERGPRPPRGLGHRGVEATPEARVQLASAEALELVVPAERPES